MAKGNQRDEEVGGRGWEQMERKRKNRSLEGR